MPTTQKQKIPGHILKQQRVHALLNYINEKKHCKRYVAQKDLEFGDGIMERTHQDLMSMYDYEVSYKKREYHLIPTTQEVIGV